MHHCRIIVEAINSSTLYQLLHKIIKQLYEGLQSDFFNNLQLVVEKSTLDSLSAPHEHRILKLKKNYARVIHDHIKHNQEVV